MFKKAAEMQLRFDTAKGQINTEDLFDLPLTSRNSISLDGLAIATNKALKATEDDSFVLASTPDNAILELKLSILKEVISDRMAANAKNLAAKENKAYKDKLVGILANKQDEELTNLSAEQLEAMIKDVA